MKVNTINIDGTKTSIEVLDKIFSASLIDKFFWAMDINKDWNF